MHKAAQTGWKQHAGENTAEVIIHATAAQLPAEAASRYRQAATQCPTIEALILLSVKTLAGHKSAGR